MILSVTLFALVTVALLSALYWLSHRSRRNHNQPHPLQTISSEKLLPQNYKYFPQVRQALSKEDDEFLATRAGENARRLARKVRRDVALEFLQGLRDDYRRLDRLART